MRIVLIDADVHARKALATRLAAQGYEVEVATDVERGVCRALSAPPAAIITNQWMDRISAVQLCSLLKAEPSTADVPIIIRGDSSSRLDRYWANDVGGASFVPKGSFGQLVRTLKRVAHEPSDSFFTHLTDGVDIASRIGSHMDVALFHSVVTSEVRALGMAESPERMADLLSQLMSRIIAYRWLAVAVDSPATLYVHTNAEKKASHVREARRVLEIPKGVPVHTFVDEDALSGTGRHKTRRPEQARIDFGGTTFGRVAIAPLQHSPQLRDLVELLGKELGGPMRMINLYQQAQRLATTDSLTGLSNRRHFLDAATRAIKHHAGDQSAVWMLDIDHFKRVNDSWGHAAGDAALEAVGATLAAFCGDEAVTGRWGGEEFAVALPGCRLTEAIERAEAFRASLEKTDAFAHHGTAHRITASIGVAAVGPHIGLEAALDRADTAMYKAKANGRNCVRVFDLPTAQPTRPKVGAPNHGIVGSTPGDSGG